MLLLGGDERGTVYRGERGLITQVQYSTVQFRLGGTKVRRSLITVKFDRVNCGGDGSAAVASPLLLCLFMAE